MSVNAAALEEYEAMLTVVSVGHKARVRSSGNPFADESIKVPDELIERFGKEAVQAALRPWRLMGWAIKRQDGTLFPEQEDDDGV